MPFRPYFNLPREANQLPEWITRKQKTLMLINAGDTEDGKLVSLTLSGPLDRSNQVLGEDAITLNVPRKNVSEDLFKRFEYLQKVLPPKEDEATVGLVRFDLQKKILEGVATVAPTT